MHTTTVIAPVHTARACETIEQVREHQAREMRELGDTPPRTPDWIVQVIADRGPELSHRWYVAGINTNHAPGAPNRVFRWEVPKLWWRYDLSRARLVTKDEAARHQVTEV